MWNFPQEIWEKQTRIQDVVEARLLYLGNELFFARLSAQRDAAKHHANDGVC